MGFAMGTVRLIMFAFNLLLSLAGLVILFVGVSVANADGADIDGELAGHISTPAIIIAIVGAFIFVFSFFGCCGAFHENYCMVVTHACLLSTMSFVLVIVAALTYSFCGEAGVDRTIKLLQDKYLKYQKDSVFVDELQQFLDCCGSVNNTTPWTELGIAAPDSCYPDKNSTAPGAKIYEEGCLVPAVEVGIGLLYYIAEIAISIAIFQGVGVVFTMCLAKSIRRAERERFA